MPERLYWISDIKPPTNISSSFYFNIDEVFNIINEGFIVWTFLYGLWTIELRKDLEIHIVVVKADKPSELQEKQNLPLHIGR